MKPSVSVLSRVESKEIQFTVSSTSLIELFRLSVSSWENFDSLCL